MSFTYDSEGLRVSKTVNGVTRHYVYDGDLLVAEYTNNETIVYIYDAFDSPIGFAYRSSSYSDDTWDVYWYGKNLQGDIVAVYNSAGTLLVSYKYTAWGETTRYYSNGGGTTTAAKNNLTYRGYYYDSDLSMYYLQSRYYDPVIGRFISSDDPTLVTASPTALTDKNLFAYCDNNPVMRVDYNGDYWIIPMLIGAAVGVVVQYVTDVITNIKNGEVGEDILTNVSSSKDYFAAAAGGALAAMPGGGFLGAIFSGAVGNVACDYIKGNISSAEDMIVSGIVGAFSNALGYGVSKMMSRIKADKILSMNRAGKKAYLTDHIFKNGRSNANANLHTFMDNPIGIIESYFATYKYGIYSTVSSTTSLAIYGGTLEWIRG